MTAHELKEIKDRLVCPICGSTKIYLYFYNSSSDEVDLAYVNADQQGSDFAHVCFCDTCSHEDDRIFFDYEEYRKYKIENEEFTRKFLAQKTLVQLDLNGN